MTVTFGSHFLVNSVFILQINKQLLFSKKWDVALMHRAEAIFRYQTQQVFSFHLEPFPRFTMENYRSSCMVARPLL